MKAFAYVRTALIGASGLVAVACFISTTTRPVAVQKGGPPARLTRVPVKAHLMNGDVVMFRAGVKVGNGIATGMGERFTLTRATAQAVSSVALDSVLGFEVYERQVNPARTLLYGVMGTAATGAAIVGGSIAIFGSCPTIYADSAGIPMLQAESFSQSIAPLLAVRDVDRMSLTPDGRGVVRLSVQNEALETHHLDQLQLIEVRHDANEVALPSPIGGLMAVGSIVSAGSIRDAAGRDVSIPLARTDGVVFSSDGALLERAVAGGPTRDHLLITTAKPAGQDSVALVLRARSSLLSTAILYDYMLGRPGASALDWLGRDLSQIANVVQLATWHAEHFGMRVEVLDGERWLPVARVIAFGPVAWSDIGVVVPAVGGDSVRMRVSFTVDEFRIDRVAIAQRVRRVEPRNITAARAFDNHGVPRDDMVPMLARADDRDVETHPGDHFSIEFDVGVAPSDTRTFMLASQGYYTEWVRGKWMKTATDSLPFSPARTSMHDVLRTWQASKDTLEQHFFQRRVPIS
jgi:hypothetical protein